MDNVVDIYPRPRITGIPEGYEPITREMDPDTEDLIWGDRLQQGYVVLISNDNIVRQDPKDHELHLLNDDLECNPWQCPRVNETSQWCMITDLRRSHDLIHFIGVYADGVKRARTYNKSFAWIVKKESM